MVDSVTTMEFSEVMNSIERDFPFDGYIRGRYQPYETVYRAVSQYIRPGQSLLDFGSGPCDKTAVAQSLGVKCTACDDFSDAWYLRDDNINKIKTFASSRGIEIMEQLPEKFEENSFDMIMANDVLEHLHDSPRLILNRLLGGLSVGGYLFITVPNLANIRKRLSLLVGRTNLAAYDLYYWYKGPWRGPVREYVRGDIEALCDNLGLQRVQLGTVHHMLHNLNKAAHPVYKGVTSLFPDWRDTWLLVAKKPKEWSPRNELSDTDFARIYGKKSRGELHGEAT